MELAKHRAEGVPLNKQHQREGLLKPEDVDEVFDDDALAWLNDTANIPAPACERFGDQVKAAARNYLSEVGRPTLKQIADSIAALGTTAGDALDGLSTSAKAAAKLDELSSEAREFLTRLGQGRVSLPTSADLLDVNGGREALKLLFSLCSSGARIKLGRRRPGAKRGWQNVTVHKAEESDPDFQINEPYFQIHEEEKRSRPHLDIQYVGPRTGHRPTDHTKMMLVAKLGLAYEQATGVAPGRHKPFLALVVDALDLLGLNAGADPDIVKRYIKELPKEDSDNG